MSLIKIGYCFAHMHERPKQCQTQRTLGLGLTRLLVLLYMVQSQEGSYSTKCPQSNQAPVISAIPEERELLFPKKPAEAPGLTESPWLTWVTFTPLSQSLHPTD